MTSTPQKIADIAESLSAPAQAALLDMARALAQPARFFDVMTDAQRAELTRSLAEAERGEVTDDAELDRELDALIAGRP
jgi:predicted transcriptional regulator